MVLGDRVVLLAFCFLLGTFQNEPNKMSANIHASCFTSTVYRAATFFFLHIAPKNKIVSENSPFKPTSIGSKTNPKTEKQHSMLWYRPEKGNLTLQISDQIERSEVCIKHGERNAMIDFLPHSRRIGGSFFSAVRFLSVSLSCRKPRL